MSLLNRVPTDQKMKPRAVYWSNRQLAWLRHRAIEDEKTVNGLIKAAVYEMYPELRELQ